MRKSLNFIANMFELTPKICINGTLHLLKFYDIMISVGLINASLTTHNVPNAFWL